jgi:transcriptional regulator with XRE-family HTH domain
MSNRSEEDVIALRDLGERLATARKSASKTQAELANFLGVNKSQVSHWEAGRSQISVLDLVALAEKLQVNPDQLLRGSNAPDYVFHGENGKLTITEAKALKIYDRAQLVAHARVLSSADPAQIKNPQRLAQREQAPMRFTVFDDALAPNIAQGQVVMVDPGLVPQPGDCVAIVLLTSQEPLFRRFRPTNQREALQPPFDLLADNSFFPIRKVQARQRPLFLGTMRERTIVGSR